MYRPESMYLNVELQTPFNVIPHLNGRYRHDFKTDSLTSSAYLALSENRPLINGNLKITQEIVDISLNTPQNRYSVNADMKMKDDTYSLSGNAAIGEKKITIAMEKTPSSININLDTPIKGYERTQIKASASRKPYHAALNIQTSYLFDIEFDARLTGQRFDELDGSLTLKTGLYNLRNIRISMKNDKNFGELKSHVEAFWTDRNGITIDASLTKTDCSLTVSTPWESLRTAYWHVKYDSLYTDLVVATNMKINKETVYDVNLKVNIFGDTFSLSGNGAIRRNKISLVMVITPFSLNINLVTPIRGYEKTHIQASVSRTHYHAAVNIQTSYLSEIDFDARLTGRILDLDGYLRLKTGFDNLRNIRMSIQNENNHEESKCHIEAFFTERNGMTIHLSRTNMDWSVSVSTPWKSLQTAYGKIKYTGRYPNWIVTTNMKINKETIYDVDLEIDIDHDKFSLFGTAANEHKKFTLTMEKTPFTLNINLETPIRGYENTQIKVSISRRYDHAAMNINIQASYISEIDFDARLTGHRIEDLDGSLTLKTGFDHLRNIRMSIKNERNLGELRSHIEAFYTERHGITIDASLTKTSLSVSLSTPLKLLRTAYGHVKYDIRSTNFGVATHLKINEETLHDVGLETRFFGDTFSLYGNVANRWKKFTLAMKITPF
ncbi:unnamed protein product [Mytilus edulis]|uniref:Uncharacterized protein n=1 Tax=Mytilus edulis TaxID=6550 RepID=A0A8S3VKG9_MYTED|nr:unnamed protein product [Mytilus edulis]